jgi:hypothetical protein
LSASDILAWIALGLLPLSALIGWFLRRKRSGRFAARMRPHFVLGYAALALALLHMAMSMGASGGANAGGIWFATIALAGLGLQAFIGTNLQSPGAYRLTLRRWHTLVFWGVLLLAIGHIALNAL